MQSQRRSSHSHCAQRLSVLADANRLAVLELLMNGSKYVWELNACLELEQSLLSHHLRILRQAGFVESARAGKSVLYQLAPGVRPNASRSIDLGCCVLLLKECDRFTASKRSILPDRELLSD